MLTLLLLRHAVTKGNLEKRYVGRTDEPLCEEGMLEASEKNFPDFYPERIFVSPMRRCKQTAKLIFSNCDFDIIDDFRETDFGDFEYQTYEELKHLESYQAFVNTNGQSGCPNGETKEEVTTRVCSSFEGLVRKLVKENISRVAIVAHGGTIMTLLSNYAIPKRAFYDWQVKNAEGFFVAVSCENKTNQIVLKVIDKEEGGS